MHGLGVISTITLLLALPFVSSSPSRRSAAGSRSGIHVPIHLQSRAGAKGITRRGEGTAVVGLGDFKDVTYGIVLTIGGKDVPVVLDTGSADLWVLSTACTTCKFEGGARLYEQRTFENSGLGVRLQYGDSRTGTHASGPIGQDTVSLLNLSLPDQHFAAINETNTSVLASGYSGIFGLGFPINSFIWHDTYVKTLDPLIYQGKREASRLFSRQTVGATSTNGVLQSLPSMGPFIPRLVMNNAFKSHMFAVALQRDAVDIGGNAGMLSIGELPPGIDSKSLTWSPVRGYTVPQKGLPPPTNAPEETYPMAWEIFVDDVFFDGAKLPRSSLPKTNISLTALVDTGNSLIRGPADVVAGIFSRLGSSQFDCSIPHNLAFQIDGKMFPVDPRDFISPVSNSSTQKCFANLVSTDTPVEGENYLYSWSLGAPFLKGVIAAFHYGNITYPSRDPPRIGFVSTVPPDADQKLKVAFSEASQRGGGFPVSSEPAPTGTFVPTRSTSTSAPTSSSVAHTPSEGFVNSSYPLYHGLQAWTLIVFLGLFGLCIMYM